MLSRTAVREIYDRGNGVRESNASVFFFSSNFPPAATVLVSAAEPIDVFEKQFALAHTPHTATGGGGVGVDERRVRVVARIATVGAAYGVSSNSVFSPPQTCITRDEKKKNQRKRIVFSE